MDWRPLPRQCSSRPKTRLHEVCPQPLWIVVSPGSCKTGGHRGHHLGIFAGQDTFKKYGDVTIKHGGFLSPMVSLANKNYEIQHDLSIKDRKMMNNWSIHEQNSRVNRYQPVIDLETQLRITTLTQQFGYTFQFMVI